MADSTKQTGSGGKVAKLASAPVAFTMLDDQKTVMHVTPLDVDGNPTSLPTGSAPPVYTADDPSSITLNPAPDGLSCQLNGVKGKAGTPHITATFTNLDGSTATGEADATITLDPAELDVTSLGVSVDAPTAQ